MKACTFILVVGFTVVLASRGPGGIGPGGPGGPPRLGSGGRLPPLPPPFGRPCRNQTGGGHNETIVQPPTNGSNTTSGGQ
ncbi:dynamin-like [Dermacentor silvarum]|uniref:dynamin-like n=1 Tax=Dermacentor silvarum TaxID=543639 RepID=UPI001896D796|nr:dynamin-like [Dermacentor silvarum]